MKVSFSISENRLLLKAVDAFYNTYVHAVPNNDPFVVNFCNRDLKVLKELLEKYEVEENDGFVVVKITQPIFLSYKLQKEEHAGDVSNMIIGKLQEMQLQIEKMGTRIGDLEEQLENGVILPGYGVIDINETELYLRVMYSNASYTNIERHTISIKVNTNLTFRGRNIEPIKYLKKLEKFIFCNGNESHYARPILEISDFSPLQHCTNLKCIYFTFCNIVNIDFMEKLQLLEQVYFIYCPEIQNINVLTKLQNLKTVVIHQCPKIVTMPQFNSGIIVTKA